MHTFCPADARIWNDNCQDVEFMNYTAISMNNELAVVSAFRKTIAGLLARYPTTVDQDRELLRDHFADVGTPLSTTMIGAINVRRREKEILVDTLGFLDAYEQEVLGGRVQFQLELKMREREISDRREEARVAFMREVQEQAALQRVPLAVQSVDLGATKVNLTLYPGEDIKLVVARFCQDQRVPQENIPALESALRARVVPPVPLMLLLGVVNPLGDRKILGMGV